MQGKSFLLVMPSYSDFPELFVKNLEKLGFHASLVTDQIPKFKYQNSERLINFFKKTFQKDKSYKKELVKIFTEKEFLKIAENLDGHFDYILVIRPDEFPISFIKKLKGRTSKLIAYQWDGIEKFPAVKNYFSLFDTFFCFENVEGVPNIRKTTNFYFDVDHFDNLKPASQSGNPILYFVGLDWENRRNKINNFIMFADENNFRLNFILQEFEENNSKNPKINYIKNRITFIENIELVKNSDVLLDFVDPRHAGLSIRFFEGLYYKKKVITDNVEVKKYDFYHPNNIFVIENNNYKLIPDFVKKSYVDLPYDIVKKYSFSEWIMRIVNA
ncbi:hypothetical protein [Soonwooa sp.]|uniref:hypothetical protein n=1 Tax=Soonwooa sp. TaxID=1938592 RepID=UPI0035AF4186